jgi:serine kinase of HPr protein (carbohydrate metabolism regulator)
LALRLICGDFSHAPLGERLFPMMLVADDQVVLSLRDGALLAHAPDALRALLEVRGVGIVPFESREQVAVSLVVDLCGRGMMPRMPDAKVFARIAGQDIPSMSLDPFENSAPLKALLTLRSVIEDAGVNGRS